MGENADDHSIKDSLQQLRCHFTWRLIIEDTEIPDLESRVLEEIEFLDTKYNVGIHNLLAYVKHLKGQHEEALQSLKAAEDMIQTEHAHQSDTRSLVTWGNYAWVYYHMGRVADAQTYLDKVENTCQKFASPFHYRIEHPQMDCEEGWAMLKCGQRNYERAKACFGKALEVEPENPEFSTGYAIAAYRRDYGSRDIHSVEPLRKAVRLNPEDAHIKLLFALKLQEMGQEAEGEKYIEEALTSTSSQTYVFRYAGKFYRRKGCVDKARQLFARALEVTPSSAYLHYQIGLCYRMQMIQIQKATNMQPRGQDREKVDRMIKLAIFHFEFALKQKPTFDTVLLILARMYITAKNYKKAEDSFQKLFLMEPHDTQVVCEGHFYYGQFLEYQKKSEVDAIRHYLKAIKIGSTSFIGNKSIHSLKKLALNKLQRNASDREALSLLGFVYKLKGEMNEALEYYEQALCLATDSENVVEHGP